MSRFLQNGFCASTNDIKKINKCCHAELDSASSTQKITAPQQKHLTFLLFSLYFLYTFIQLHTTKGDNDNENDNESDNGSGSESESESENVIVSESVGAVDSVDSVDNF